MRRSNNFLIDIMINYKEIKMAKSNRFLLATIIVTAMLFVVGTLVGQSKCD